MTVDVAVAVAAGALGDAEHEFADAGAVYFGDGRGGA
jgi:hypothetical protein